MTPFELVRERLERAGSPPRRSGSQWEARCPAHEDRTASLSIREGEDGRALLKCFADCETEAVAAALGLRMADLSPPCERGDGDDWTPAGPAIATYFYTDAKGRVLFGVCRTADKQFRQWRPDPSKRHGRAWSLKGVKLVLYRLPRVLAAIDEGQTIYVVEGEKDCHALEQAGAVATCNPAGAGKWRDAYAETLAGASVVVVADRDEPGRKHARQVVASLRAHGCAVRVVEAAEGKDAADHLAAGHGLDDFRPLAEEPAEQAASEWEPAAPLGAVYALPAFPVEVLPEWLGEFVRAVVVAIQVPADLPGMLGLAVLATAAARRVRIMVRRGWEEPLNAYVAVAMPPGSGKSPVFDVVTAPLRALERELVMQAGDEVTKKETERKVAEQRADKAKQRAGKAEGAEVATALAEAISAAQEAAAIEVPAVPQLIGEDATPEAVASLLAEQGGRLALLSDEGGPLELISRYRETPNLEVYLKGHSANVDLRVNRKGRPTEIVERPTLTIGLAVQPDVLRALADRPELRGRGLTARPWYALPADNVGSRDVDASPVPAVVAERYHRELLTLARSLARPTGPDGREAVLTLEPEAAALHLAFRRELEPRMHAEIGDLAHVREWASKLAGAVARIAGLLHLATHLRGGWDRPVAAETMRGALQVGHYLIKHALAVFDLMGADPALKDARYLWALIKRNQLETFTVRDLMRTKLPKGRFRKADELERPLDLLEAHGYVRQLPAEPRGPKGGRPPSPAYKVNPLALAESEPGSAGSAGSAYRTSPNEDPPREEASGWEPDSDGPGGQGAAGPSASAGDLYAKPAQPAEPQPIPTGFVAVECPVCHAAAEWDAANSFGRQALAEGHCGQPWRKPEAAEDARLLDPGPARGGPRRGHAR